MTVAQLIEKLQKMPQDVEVFTQDYYGPSVITEVWHWEDRAAVVIE